jgi:hypothetical protein
VEGVDDDADGRSWIRLGDVERLTERGDHTAVGGVDRVHRLDGQHHPGRRGVVDECPDDVCGSVAGAEKIPVTIWQATRDEDQHRCGAGGTCRDERGRLLDRAAVLVQGRPVRRGVRGGEEAAAA